jgi:long-subunit acyl-CoA synthetase (AMP-forming)
MTPTMKIKRGDVEKKYQDQYEAWYEDANDIIWEGVE